MWLAKVMLQSLESAGSGSTTHNDSGVSDSGRSDPTTMPHTYAYGFQTLPRALWSLGLCVSAVVKAMDFSRVLCPSCSHGSKYVLDKRKKKNL